MIYNIAMTIAITLLISGSIYGIAELIQKIKNT